MGLGFDPWQDGAGRIMLAKRADGLYAADTFAMSIPRQVGKTYFVGSSLFGMCANTKLTAIWTAHRTRTAGETFRSMQGLAKRKDVAPHIARIVLGAGTESVEFTNGSRILFGARERGFGRGFSEIDVLVFDEAQILSESAMDDMIPATNAASNPLVVMLGTPPKPSDPGEVFTMIREEALSGEGDGIAYIEFSADRHADHNDREAWRKANPSFPHRTSERAMLRMKKNLSEDSFRREALGVWDESIRHRAAIKPAEWEALTDVGPADGTRPHALAVDMSPLGDISVSACWIEDEFAHAEEVWAGTDSEEVVRWIAGRTRRRTPVMILGSSPAAALIPQLRARSVTVNQATAGDMAKACSLLVNRVKAGTFTHAGQEPVADALAIARRKSIGAAGGWGWDLSDETVNISPIVSMTFALLEATVTKRIPNEARGGGRGTRARRSTRGRKAVIL
ncbi:terminase [Rhodococcus pyridinivorans]